MNITIYRDEAAQMDEAHAEGWHEEAPREGCPSCSRRDLSSYPERPPKGKRKRGMTAHYEHAAPFIREQILNAGSRKLHATTQKARREHVGEMTGLIKALKILLSSPEGEDSPIGFPKFTAGNFGETFAEIERFVGGAQEMVALGFTPAADDHEHGHSHG
jgi:hypothetical protein